MVFIFTRCIPTPWIFACAGISAVVQCGQSQGIRSWEFSSFLVSEQAARDSQSEFLRGFIVVHSTGGFVKLLFSILFPVCLEESTKLSEGQLCYWKKFRGSLVPALCYFRLVTKKLSWNGFLDFTTVILIWPYFLIFCKEREIKVEVIEEMFITVIHLIITNLPCLD